MTASFACLAFMRIAKLPQRIRLGTRLLFYCSVSSKWPAHPTDRQSRWEPNEHVLCAHSLQIEYLIIIIFSVHALHGRHFSIQYFARIHPQATSHHTAEIKWTPKHVFYYPSTYTKYSRCHSSHCATIHLDENAEAEVRGGAQRKRLKYILLK